MDKALGVIDGLSMLEKLVNEKRQSKTSAPNTEITRLKQKIRELEKRRDDLKEELNRTEQNEETQTDLEGEKEKLQNLKLAHRLSGTSLSVVDNGIIRLCFDTSYKGHYFEPYYAEIDGNDDGIRLLRHTFPVFIPVKMLEAKMKTSLKSFIEEVHNHLRAFVTRRQEVVLAKSIPNLSITSVETSSSYDVIKLALALPSDGFLILTLLYKEAVDLMPARVKVNMEADDSLVEGSNEEIIDTIKTCVKSQPLSLALQQLARLLSLPS